MGLGFSSGFRFGFVPSPFQSVGFCQTAIVPIVSFCTFSMQLHGTHGFFVLGQSIMGI